MNTGTRDDTRAETWGDRLGAAPQGDRMRNQLGYHLRSRDFGTPLLDPPTTTTSSSDCCAELRPRIDPRAADGASAVAGVGSPAAALALAAAATDLPHALVAARSLHEPATMRTPRKAALSCHHHI